jgi:hypothetical protein
VVALLTLVQVADIGITYALAMADRLGWLEGETELKEYLNRVRVNYRCRGKIDLHLGETSLSKNL